MVYGELHRQAARYLRPERKDHTLQPTALVHEAYLKIAKPGPAAYQDRHHFFALAAQAMRRILVDHARAHNAGKRGGDQTRITLDVAFAVTHQKTLDVLALDEALERLAQMHPRQTRVVELRFFGGLSIPEIAEVFHVSEKTIKRDWEAARTWLFGALGNE